jgi:hypothetical protein
MKPAVMPAGSELKNLQRGSFRYFPVLPGRLEFAVALRAALLRERPKVVAVELPSSLEHAFRRAVKRLPEITVLVWPEETARKSGDDEEEARAVYLPVEPCDPFIEAVRTGLEIGAEILFIEPDLTLKPHLSTSAPDPYAIKFIGYEKYVEEYRLQPPRRTANIAAHAAGIAWKLQGADPIASTFVVLSLNLVDPVLDLIDTPQDEPEATHRREDVQLINPHPDCLAEILIEYPFLQHRYDNFRAEMSDEHSVDRPRVQLEVLRYAEQTYQQNTGDKLAHWQRQLMARYTRNLAVINGDLVAGIFDLAVAARSIVDDNYGWEVWDFANRYPAQKSESDLETINISGEEVWINAKRLRLRRRLPRFKQRVRPSTLKRRKKEKYPGEWAEQLNGDSICSYPPEDLMVENYGAFLKKKAKSILSDERERTVPFTTSLLDGIDLRETIRNWHEKKIYVRQQEKLAGDVGSIVVIFDEDRLDRYDYLTTWLGEHQNESDMAFYATHPFDHIVGPGIGRAEYGGFLMTLPPRRMFDVWSDPDYDFAETKAERLLMAGIDYSVEKLVVYVASKPPRSVFRTIAGRLGQKILYIPIGQLSPAQLKKIRVVHVLDSHKRRAEAKEYLW